jgi:hypothetical protein
MANIFHKGMHNRLPPERRKVPPILTMRMILSPSPICFSRSFARGKFLKDRRNVGRAKGGQYFGPQSQSITSLLQLNAFVKINLKATLAK